jgi:branched-chain amino acid transport system permease protein
MVGEPVFSVAILTIGIDILIRTVLDNWIGLNPRYMGDSFTQMGNFGSLNIGGVAIQFLELTALLSAIGVIALLSVFFKFSKYGLAMRATSFDQEASLAQGINVGRVIALVWFIAAMLASLSGFFITGGFNGLTQASFVTALRALPAIVIGGLDSLVGAVVGSLIIGMTQGYIAYYQLSIEAKIGFSFGTGFSSLAPYVIMFFILIVKPDGIFGKEEVERV